MWWNLGAFRDPTTGQSRPDSEIEQAARAYIKANWNVKPTKSLPGFKQQTVEDVTDRIVTRFVERYQFDWNAGVPLNEIIGDINLNRVVVEIAPLSTPKSKSVLPKPSTKVTKEDFSKPKPGSVDTNTIPWEEITKIVQSGLSTWTDLERDQLLADLARKKQQGQSAYIPGEIVVESEYSTGAKIGIGLGTLAIGGLITWLVVKSLNKKSTLSPAPVTVRPVKGRKQ